MSGNTTFELIAQDHVDAVRAHTGRVFGKLSWVLLGVAFLFPLLDLWAGVPIMEDTAFWLCLGLALFFLAWDWIARDWIVRRAFRQGEAMRTAIRINWDDQAIRFETEISNSEYRWDRFFRWMASKKSLLLYRDSQFFIVIPRRGLPEGAADEMVAALRAAGVREKGLFQSAQSSPISR
ncbi:MAG TPA: YcxB family protein [Sphingomicrobium sp.]|nr:YcxB family protein [Sphingomicrobium sp.]